MHKEWECVTRSTPDFAFSRFSSHALSALLSPSHLSAPLFLLL
jgi:hypothetical protein